MAAPKKPYDAFADRGDGGLSTTEVRGKTVYRAKKYVGLVESLTDDGAWVKRPKYISGQGATKQAAKAALARNLAAHYRLAEEERLLPRAQRTLSLSSYYYDTWLVAATASDRYKTGDGLDVTRRRMEMHALPALGSRPLRDIAPTDVKALVEVTLPTKGLGAHAVTGVRKTLHAVLADALEEGHITHHPMERIRWRTRAPRREVDAPPTIIEAVRPRKRARSMPPGGCSPSPHEAVCTGRCSCATTMAKVSRTVSVSPWSSLALSPTGSSSS